MADQQQGDYIPYDPTTAITQEDYDTIHKEKEQFEQLLLQARGERLERLGGLVCLILQLHGL